MPYFRNDSLPVSQINTLSLYCTYPDCLYSFHLQAKRPALFFPPSIICHIYTSHFNIMQLKLLIITVLTSTAAANYNATGTGGYIPTSTRGLSPIMTAPSQGAAAPSTQFPGSALGFVVAAGVALVSYFPLAIIPCSVVRLSTRSSQ